MMKQLWFTQSWVRAHAPCSKQFGTRHKRQAELKVSDTVRACALPHNRAVNQNAFVRHAACEARRFPPSAIAQKRLVSAALDAENHFFHT
jgi:hypothetical protein